jgi:hypothetical protein
MREISRSVSIINRPDEPIAGLALAAPPPTRSKPSSVTIPAGAAAQIKHFVEHLYCLGPRPVFEALCAIEGGAGVIEILRDYSRLDLAVVAFLGANRFPRRHQRKRRPRCRRWH